MKRLTGFTLTGNFNPNKVVTFGNIKTLYITNLMTDKQLLNCSNPDDSVVNVCDGIVNLLNDLTSTWRKLTINDVYKMQVYQSTIAKAIFYVWTLKYFKKWAIVLWIDKAKNILKSIDLVRSYTTYDIQNNDVLPLTAKEIDIDVTSTKPVLNKDDVSIVLWLNDGSVVWMKLFPLDQDPGIPGANMYKTMTIKWWTQGCSSYTDSIWYGYDKLWMSHKGVNLEPVWTKWIEMNVNEHCYSTFNNIK